MSVVGIDLGTTNTVVACVRSGKVHVLADEHGQRLLPSVVSFHPNGEVLVGSSAKARRVIDPKNTVYSHKRLIGRSWGSPEIAQARQRFAFELKEGPGQGPLVQARGQDYTLPEISAFVLKRARQIAETALGTPVERAVITVPAHFNELQRASTKVAGRVSGLEVLRILNEPTAAALAYGLGRTGNERVAVYDFGGGTFDCTLLDLNGNVFEVLATAGDSFLGGDDVDNMIAERMAESFLKAHRYDPRSDPQMLERLKTSAEELKTALSTAETHTVVLKDFHHGVGGSSIHFTFTLTRRDLEAMITPLVDRTFKVTQDALSLARLTPSSFDKVILVGGSTRIPLVRKRVEAFFGAPPMDRVNPDEVVAIGAAIQGAALTEGARKRSLPAPPPVPAGRAPRPSAKDAPPPGPAFGSEPPSFGYGSSPPASGVPGARPRPEIAGGARKITNPGVAPATQPMGARGAPPAPPPGAEEDPSIASFPDLAAPTPFEWFPSGTPSAGQAGSAASERSFGGNTITQTGVEQQTLTATAAIPSRGAPSTARTGPGAPAQDTVTRVPALPDEEEERGFGDFGAVDEPPSLYSTPSASVPSFPSMTAGAGGVPSPLGDAPQEPFGQVKDLSLISTTGTSTPGASQPDGGFGQIKDLSLISTTGTSSPGAPQPDGGFGQIKDLSLISSSAETGSIDAITEARKRAVEDGAFDDETDAMVRPKAGTMNLGPARGGPAVLQDPPDETADLPAVVQSADLPAVVKGKKPEPRRPGQLGMSPQGTASMMGKPPPPVAPQPFGPMEKIDEPPMSRTAAMPNRPPAPAKGPPPAPKTAPATARGAGAAPRPPPAPQTTAPMPARQGAQNQPPAAAPPFGSQVPPAAFPAQPAPPPPAFAAPPTAATAPFGSAAAPPPFGGPPPLGSAPPPAGPSGAFGAAPPPAGPFGSAPPPGPSAGFGSAPPPGAFGSAPPGIGSQPPIFGAFNSAPPEPASNPPPFGAPPPGFDPSVPMAPPAPQNLGFAAPVLVDVTPRGLVVETAGGYTDTIIPRNSKIPCERTRRFATGRDMQTTVRVRVAQGENPHFPENTYLGEVELSGLRPAARGDVVVAVTFEVDADGTLRVRARDVQTGQEARATLQLVGVADESSVVMMINRFAQQPVVGGPGPTQ